jgi:hypothetical protein
MFANIVRISASATPPTFSWMAGPSTSKNAARSPYTKKSIGWVSSTPSSVVASSTARSPISSARRPKASSPSDQWTRTSGPSSVRHSTRSSSYRMAVVGLSSRWPSASVTRKPTSTRVFGYRLPNGVG